MARCLKVSTRSYYDWRSGKTGLRAQKASSIKEKIERCFETSKRLYGSSRISSELRAQDDYISRPTVAKYMNIMGLRSVLAPAFKVCTTDSKHNNHIAENLLDRNFVASKPNLVWVSDITYMHTRQGFLYLTTIIDLFDRKVVGWSLSRDMTTQNTVIKAFRMALKHRCLSAASAHGLMLHSDRGSQYSSKEFIELIDCYGVIRSNSRKGNCWDNAVAESFFKTLKCELIYRMGLKNMEQTSNAVFEYIECWYNKKRRHSALGNLNIDKFWMKYYEKMNIKLVA